ncbi:MAG: hypothetical protein PVI01_19650 [Gemmatimonadales bacterium]
MDRILGLLASSLDRLDVADTHFQEAIAGCRPGGGVVEPAWALYERAALLMKRGRGDDAREAAALLDESLALAEKLILAPLVERTRALRQET